MSAYSRTLNSGTVPLVLLPNVRDDRPLLAHDKPLLAHFLSALGMHMSAFSFKNMGIPIF